MDDDELNNLFGMDDEGTDGDAADEGAGSDDDKKIEGLVEEPYNPEENEEQEASEEVEEITDEQLDELFEDDEEESDESEGSDEEDEEEAPRLFVAGNEEPDDEDREISAPNFDIIKNFPLDAKSTLLLSIAIVVVLIVVLIATLPAFRISNIEVKGNYVLKSEDVIQRSGIAYGNHLFFADYNGAAKAISSISPYVRDCKVTFSIPSTVTITIDERSKIANVKTPDGYAALDDQGIVLELSSSDSKGEVAPVISGLNITHAAVGRKIVIGDESDYQKALIVLGSLLAADMNNPNGDYSIFENTKEVRVLPSGYMFLTIRLPNGHTLQVKMDGLEQISTQAAWLLYVIDSNVFDNGFPSGSLDMTGDEYIYREFSISEDDPLQTEEGNN